MDEPKSKIRLPIIPVFIKNIFSIHVEFTQVSKDYNEEIIIQFFKESTIEQKEIFFKTCFTLDVMLQNHPFHVDSILLNE